MTEPGMPVSSPPVSVALDDRLFPAQDGTDPREAAVPGSTALASVARHPHSTRIRFARRAARARTGLRGQVAHLCPPPDGALRAARVRPRPLSRRTSGDGNLIIHGDNLHGLKALLPRYHGRVKCVYIDPPYNTGNEGWSYNDNARGPVLQRWYKDNGPVDGDDPERHEKWLCMMWPRLRLLKELLAEDGVIFVSTDDNELHHLRMLMDEIFEERNFVANIVWNHRKSRQNDIDISLAHNHMAVYACDREQFSLSNGEVDESSFANPDDDQRDRGWPIRWTLRMSGKI